MTSQETGQESVLEVVEGQRENLTNEDYDIRAKAINTINRLFQEIYRGPGIRILKIFNLEIRRLYHRN